MGKLDCFEGGAGMNGAFYIGATGLHAQQRALDVVANNIGNINTTAFKRSEVRFSELVTPGLHAGTAEGKVKPGFAGVVLQATPRVWTPGDLQQTSDAAHIAIDGAGFIEVMGPEGRGLLWRGGILKVNSDGFLATEDGMTLRSMISMPNEGGAVSIDRSGVVSIDGVNGIEEIGRIELTMVKDLSALSAFGSGYYEAQHAGDIYTVAAGEEGGGTFAQGALEGSNVQLSDEMVRLMLFQRVFASSAQIVQAGDQLMSIVNNLRK